MAIRVQYGGGPAGSAAGQIIAQAGQRELDREQQGRMASLARQFQASQSAQVLSAQRDAQMRSIDASADLQRQSADDAMKRTALQAGLGAELQEQEYDLRIQEMQAQAKKDAEKFEYEYSAKDRQRKATNNNNRSAVAKALSEKRITQSDADSAYRQLDADDFGINPTAYMADLNKPPPLLDRLITGPDGNIYADARTVSKVGDYRYSKEGLEVQAKIDVREKTASDRNAFEDKLWLERSTDPKTGREVGLGKTKIDAIMRERYGSQYELSNEEQRAVVESELGRKYPGGPELPLPSTPGDPANVPQRRQVESVLSGPQREIVPTGPESDWWSGLESQGIPVSEERRKMPLEKGAALSVYDAQMEKYGSFENVPDELKPALAEIIKTIRKHRGK